VSSRESVRERRSVSDPGDTIAAIATPRGNGGVGIIRLSGPAVGAILGQLGHTLPEPRRAKLARLHDRDGTIIDEVLLLYFPAPASFTGEDVLEIHGHGGGLVMDMLLERVLELGCRSARPGEFSERAFLNGKLDLAQAEAIADLIESQTRAAARGAMRSLQGLFSNRVHVILDELTGLRSLLEAHLDFPDEELPPPPADEITIVLNSLQAALAQLLGEARQGRVLRDGLHLVLAGRPNSGKSSLLNRLAENDIAIVSDIPGTTRDVIRERVHIEGVPVDVTDTAGLRLTDDTVEAEGVRRARSELESADRVLLLVDDREGDDEEIDDLLAYLPAGTPVTLIRNKIDLSGAEPGIGQAHGHAVVRLSVKSGAGMDRLLEHLRKSTGLDEIGEGVFVARRRHLQALQATLDHLLAGRACLDAGDGGLEVVAEELRLAQLALAEITGEFTSEDLLGRIFADFCIGK